MEAWNTTTGDTNVIIAIVDDAIDLDHEDLADNIFTNWVEYHGTDGVDDDFNGYVDDVLDGILQKIITTLIQQ